MAFLDELEELHESQWLEMKEAGAGLLAFGFEYEITNYLPQCLLDYRETTSEVRR